MSRASRTHGGVPPTRPLTALLCVSLASVLVLAACGSDGEGGGGNDDTLTISTTQFLNVIPTEIGLEDGTFEKHDLTLEQETVRVSTDAMSNLVAGRAEVANVQASAIQQAAKQGVDLVILAPSWVLNARNPIFVPKDSDIESVEDLRDKKIAVANLSGVATAGLLLVLEENGLDQEDVELVAAPTDQAAQALASGSVDAAQIVEPYAAQSADDVRELLPDMYAPFGSETVAGYWVTTRKVAEEQRALVSRFVDAIEEANDTAASDPERARASAAALLKVDGRVAERMAMPGFGNDEQLDQMQSSLERMTDMGFIEGPVIELSAHLFSA